MKTEELYQNVDPINAQPGDEIHLPTYGWVKLPDHSIRMLRDSSLPLRRLNTSAPSVPKVDLQDKTNVPAKGGDMDKSAIAQHDKMWRMLAGIEIESFCFGEWPDKLKALIGDWQEMKKDRAISSAVIDDLQRALATVKAERDEWVSKTYRLEQLERDLNTVLTGIQVFGKPNLKGVALVRGIITEWRAAEGRYDQLSINYTNTLKQYQDLLKSVEGKSSIMHVKLDTSEVTKAIDGAIAGYQGSKEPRLGYATNLEMIEELQCRWQGGKTDPKYRTCDSEQ